ncbi:hypothetical protein H6F75_00260 [Nodosilinea sp. FACHB-131]|uniref:hypothetical protein n=1 Tax=Cyanophyceae TaxID=3028117 RepID=UPI001687B73B|nr:hypothetical protein [Nodosilinea sp. FACHB-131]MBD1871902.1 hypothetical protein [Nodosilinea sp. FACHB-131]
MNVSTVLMKTVLEKGLVEFDIPYLTRKVSTWRFNITSPVEVFVKPVFRVENVGCDSTIYAELLVIDEFAESKAKDLAQYLMADCYIDECLIVTDGTAKRLCRGE